MSGNPLNTPDDNGLAVLGYVTFRATANVTPPQNVLGYYVLDQFGSFVGAERFLDPVPFIHLHDFLYIALLLGFNFAVPAA